MRLELALIVGILFFCSWCAYIVARMNSSVNAPPSSGMAASGDLSFQQQHLEPAGDHQYSANGTAHRAGPTQHQQLIDQAQQQQQARAFGASEPVPARFGYSHRAAAPYAGGLGGSQPPPAQLQQQLPGQSGADFQAQGAYLAGNHAPHGSPQWLSYALPTSGYAPAAAYPLAQASEQLLGQGGSPSGQGQAGDEAPEEEEEQDEGEGEQDSGQEPAQEPSQEQPSEDYPAGSGDPAGSEDQAPEEEDEEQQRPQSELEEVANRRSFDELQSDSSERDKEGRVVRTRRRHLINGRPVALARSIPPAAGAGPNEEDEDDSESEAPPPEAREARHANAPSEAEDFERLVHEIDQEDRLRKQQAGQAPAGARQGGAQVAGSQVPAAVLRRAEPVAAAARRSDEPQGASASSAAPTRTARPTKRARPKKRDRNSHAHSLQESLTAQQWDDDSATSGQHGGHDRTAAEPELSEDEDQHEVSNIVERDAEARKLERMSRDLLQDPARVSRELDAGEEATRRRRRRRRKRQVTAGQPSAQATGSGPHGSELAARNLTGSGAHNPLSGLEGRVSAGPPPTDAPRGGVAGPPPVVENFSNARTGGTQSVAEAAGPDPARSGRPDARQTVDPAASGPADEPLRAQFGVASAHNSSNWKPDGPDLPGANEIFAPRPAGGHLAPAYLTETNNETSGEATAATADVSGLDDMHVEVLANPPGFTAPGLALGVAPQPPHLLAAGSPLGLHANSNRSHLASGSHKKVVKKKKKKSKSSKKKKFMKKKKSKLKEAKYKAASAYANKHASKAHKGHLRKKKRKSQKKLSARKKHFKGSMRGNKYAHGEGAHGAKKGALYYKDKGYKKKGFKKAYHKLETGDHKTYFDEFRDKDHKKKWKNFDDKHKYSQKKKWSGSDAKHLNQHDLKVAKARASKAGQWRDHAANKHLKAMDKYKKSRKSSSKSSALKLAKKKKKKKKKKVVEKAKF